MKRWNGWGNVETTYPLPDSAREYISGVLGNLAAPPDATLETVLGSLPATRLPEHPLIDRDPATRLRYARGHSLPDWVALRSGQIGAAPDGVAFPADAGQVRQLIAFAQEHSLRLIPYGGGTSVVGHINPLPGSQPVLTVSLERLNQMLDLDETSRLATFGAGVAGPDLENQLRRRGYTLGHYPQSFEYSTLGGWIATRSSGQQSYHYGRIEQMFAGGSLETPLGQLELPVFPASAAGPDVRESVLGSEGRLGIITQATVRIRQLPEAQAFYGVFFPSWEQGTAAVRSIAQNELRVSMLRLSNPLETAVTLILSGKEWVKLADRGLRWLGYGDGRCLLIYGVTGARGQVNATRHAVNAICRQHGGLYTGTPAGHTWEKSRFLSPYLRNTLWEAGIAVDTLETALPWAQVPAASAALPQAIVSAAAAYGEQVLAFAHLSHLYRDGASIYTTYLFRRGVDSQALLERWQAMKRAATLVLQQHGGTVSHQHGVGVDHAAYLSAEKGALGMLALRSLCQTFDPQGLMNPGKLIA